MSLSDSGDRLDAAIANRLGSPEAHRVAARAAAASRIFDALGLVVLVIGGLGTLVALLSALTALDDSALAFFIALIGAAAVAAYTAITWAGVALGTALAGYIALRTRD